MSFAGGTEKKRRRGGILFGTSDTCFSGFFDEVIRTEFGFCNMKPFSLLNTCLCLITTRITEVDYVSHDQSLQRLRVVSTRSPYTQ